MELDMSAMLSIFLGIALGVSLSAAAGFRVFVPFLIMSVAALRPPEPWRELVLDRHLSGLAGLRYRECRGDIGLLCPFAR